MKWVGQKEEKPTQEVFNNAKTSEWNIKSKYDGIVVYKHTYNKILFIRQEENNGGWDMWHLTEGVQKQEDSTKDDEDRKEENVEKT
eukprot:11926593-Ditylum_brightwellii.AAC.1